MGARRLIRSFGHALAGLGHVLKTERNARIHVTVAGLVGLAGLWLGVTRADWLWLGGAIGMVWVAESMNTAFEYLCDAVQPDPSEAVRRAKDIAAGATLVAAGTAVWIGGLVFTPYYF